MSTDQGVDALHTSGTSDVHFVCPLMVRTEKLWMIVIDCDRKAQWNEGMVHAVLHVITEIFHNHCLATSQKMVTIE